MSIEVFYCYAQEDKDLREKLDRHLSELKRSGTIKSWYNGEINPGTEWKKVISDHLKHADLVLLLISSDFLSSNHCYDEEMKQALGRHGAGEAVVIPILLRPVDWEGSPFSVLQMLPSEAKPVTLWENKDEAFTDIAKGIRRTIKEKCPQSLSSPGVLSPPSVWLRRSLPAVRRRILICLVLVLVVGGSLGTWIVSSRTATAPTLTKRTATAPALANPGQVWHAQNSGTSQTLDGGVWSGSQFVVVGSSGTSLTSPNGRTWTAQNSGTSANLLDGVWSGSQFVVVGSSGMSLTSPDGRTWMAQYNFVNNLDGVAWSGSQFVVVGYGGGIFTSPDGRIWTEQNSGTLQTLFGVAWSGSQFVAVGNSGTILVSPDGRTWTTQNSGIPANLSRVAWSGSQFVVVGSSGTILTSPDGHTWTVRQSSTNGKTLLAVTWGGSQFVVVGNSGTILTSPDGRTWTTQNSGIPANLSGVAWSGSQFVVVGSNGTILTSP